MASERYLWLQERALVLLQNLVRVLPITDMEEPQRSTVLPLLAEIAHRHMPIPAPEQLGTDPWAGADVSS